MPLFGKKNKKEEKDQPPPDPHTKQAYPTQPPSYAEAVGDKPPQRLVMQGSFDSGARFSATNPPTIPPTPPGLLPHPIQVAAMTGQPIEMVHPKLKMFQDPTSDGGATLW